MGLFDDLINKTRKIIDDVEYSDDRSQGFLEKFWSNREDLKDAIGSSHGKEKENLNKLLNLFNRKGYENDMESW